MKKQRAVVLLLYCLSINTIYCMKRKATCRRKGKTNKGIPKQIRKYKRKKRNNISFFSPIFNNNLEQNAPSSKSTTEKLNNIVAHIPTLPPISTIIKPNNFVILNSDVTSKPPNHQSIFKPLSMSKFLIQQSTEEPKETNIQKTSTTTHSTENKQTETIDLSKERRLLENTSPCAMAKKYNAVYGRLVNAETHPKYYWEKKQNINIQTLQAVFTNIKNVIKQNSILTVDTAIQILKMIELAKQNIKRDYATQKDVVEKMTNDLNIVKAGILVWNG